MSTRSSSATDPLMEQFLLESREQLQRASQGLLELEDQPDDLDRVDGIFREVHTVKGSTGLFEMPALTRLVHAGEQLLQAMKSGELSIDGETIDLALAMVDRVLEWLDALEVSGDLPRGATEQGAELAERIERHIREPGDAVAANPEGAAGNATAEEADGADDLLRQPPQALKAFAPATLRQLFRQAMDGGRREALLLGYHPDREAFFEGEDPLALLAEVPELHALMVEEPDDWGETETFDPYCCRLAFHALSLAEPETLEAGFARAGGQLTTSRLAPAALVCLQGESGGTAVAGDLLDEARAALEQGDSDRLERVITTGRELLGEELFLRDGLEWLAVIESAPGVATCWSEEILAALREERQPDFAGLAGIGSAGAAAPETPAEGGGLFAEADAGGGLFADPQPSQRVEARPDHTDPEEPGDAAGGLFPDAPGVPEASSRESENGAGSRLQGRDADRGEVVRAGRGNDSARNRAATRRQSHAQVRLDQLDRLGELVGELVVARNGLPHLARQAEKEHENRDLAREIKSQGALIERVTRELQRAVSDVQMQPVSTTFQRYRRMVRDLARKLEKDVELVLEGEDTEADRDVIEALVDPLTHLVRNSLDHGIESAAERRAADKPERARLLLRARYTGDWLNIDVEDDGRGLDAEVIGRKAVDRGIIDEAEMAELDEEERRRLIFAPGFSTSDAVSDVSGRGVGMDAVQNAVRDLGGRLELASTPGEGTRTTLVLPLSMAVNKVMEVDIHGHPVGIPVSSVVEISRVSTERIEAVRDQRVVVLREQVIPVLDLHAALGIPAPEEGDGLSNLVVVRHGEQLLALEVDRVLEDRDVVVKPLEGILAGNPAFSGSALLGDGRILLILDLRGLVR